MTIQICLLISDDADDHHAFSEALSEYGKTVVLSLLDDEKAQELIKAKKFFPDFIFIDLSMDGIKINTLLKIIKADTLVRTAPVIVYGEERDFDDIENSEGLVFFDKDYEYSGLKSFLADLIRPES